MSRIILEKEVKEGVQRIKLIKDNQELEVLVTSKGYGNIYIKSNTPSFIVDKDNYAIYEVFDKLYFDFINCNILGDVKEELKLHFAYQKLVKNGIIKWYCDNFICENAPSFTIEKTNDSYIINFYNQDITIGNKYDGVKIGLNGSKYYPFNTCFMTFYRNLKKLNHNENQIHIEEYLAEKTLVKRI